MALSSYGRLAVLPRELRDQIYQDSLAPDRVEAVFDFNGNESFGKNTLVTLNVGGPDTSILLVSRAVRMEILDTWKKKMAGSTLHRLSVDRYGDTRNQSINASPWNKLYQVLCVPPLRDTRKSPGNYELRKIRIIFPDFTSLLDPLSGKTETALSTYETWLVHTFRPTAHLTIKVQNPIWPVPLPVEENWWQRLHEGTTRRSLIDTRERQARRIALQIVRIVSRWRAHVARVSLELGDGLGAAGCDGSKEFWHVVAQIGKFSGVQLCSSPSV